VRLSIIIPTYNRVHYLKQALESALSQDCDEYEVVVSDNASTDGTLELLQQYSNHSIVRYFRNTTNIGMVSNWRRAVFELARGDWFILLSDDDYLIDRRYLRKVSDLISKNADLALVYANGYLLNDQTGEKQSLNLPFSGIHSGQTVFCSRGAVKPQDFTLCNVVFRRDLARQFNVFLNPNNLSCDTELFLLSCLQGKVAVINEVVSVYRFHPNNLLKLTSKSPSLSYGSFDSLISPYVLARKMGLLDSAEMFRKSSKIDQVICYEMLKMACLDRSLFWSAKAALLERVPELANDVFQGPKYLILESLSLMFPFLYRLYKNSQWVKEKIMNTLVTP
jgi:glycosyltransferase involved in cell wall biosynthesis